MQNERRRRRSNVEQPSNANDQMGHPTQANDDTVRGRAYEIYEGRGGEAGHDLDDWLQAERELRPKPDDY